MTTQHTGRKLTKLRRIRLKTREKNSEEKIRKIFTLHRFAVK